MWCWIISLHITDFFFFNQHTLKKFLQKITWVEIYLFLFEKTAQLDKFNNFIKIHGKE
jgi:hypothetical protein